MGDSSTMELKELKKYLEAGVAPRNLIIFIKNSIDDSFLINQYIKAICDTNNLLRRNIQSLTEENSALGFVMDYTDDLKVLTVDTFEEFLDSYDDIEDTIVICNKIDKKIKSLVADYVIEIPALKDWQIKAYMKMLVPTLSDENIDWLYAAADKNIYRIINELDKLALFNPAEQKVIFDELKYEPGTDLVAVPDDRNKLSKLNTFIVANAVFDGKKTILLELLKHKDTADVDFLGLVSNILTKAKQMLLILKKEKDITAETLGCSPKQFGFILNACNNEYAHFPISYLQYLISFLSEIDLKLKSGLLDMSKEAKLDYLITRLTA